MVKQDAKRFEYTASILWYSTPPKQTKAHFSFTWNLL
jgi:hypothetical protein